MSMAVFTSGDTTVGAITSPSSSDGRLMLFHKLPAELRLKTYRFSNPIAPRLLVIESANIYMYLPYSEDSGSPLDMIDKHQAKCSQSIPATR